MWPYYIALAFIIFNIIVFAATIPFLHSRKSDTEQGKTHKNAIVAGLLVLVMFLFLLVDYLFIVNGREWVYASNWMYRYEGTARSKHNFQLAKRFSFRHVLEVLATILEGKIIKH